MTLPDGITDLAPGKIAAVVTYLEMTARPVARAVEKPAELTLLRHDAPDLEWYRKLYRRVGEDYLWFSRLLMAEDVLKAHLASEAVEVWSVHKAGEDLGLLELEWMPNGDCELSFFGLAPALIGGGVGRWLMEHAFDRAFSRPIKRFFVHTCTLDSAQALGFYRRAGFVPYGRAIEIVDDPRLSGVIGLDRAAHVPLLRP
ncbi:GNAT family N-acetyltransferase [Phaeobacter sp. B1627]|uniref:GNAT family N-acetyltransferase n=1 Tax=Phaeobacter sp. B1627 TaxID=2583809 RepID=UPI001118B386|nr:GNAT family N-acetyltransferase [Phaeobacter sp. B1627]TNJ44016.1 GNAT family N-acetyltransferase [Phaeobacter sp. B1627]